MLETRCQLDGNTAGNKQDIHKGTQEAHGQHVTGISARITGKTYAEPVMYVHKYSNIQTEFFWDVHFSTRTPRSFAATFLLARAAAEEVRRGGGADRSSVKVFLDFLQLFLVHTEPQTVK